MNEQVRDRARGALLGHLVGDALGAQVEFSSADAIARRFPNGVREMTGGGPWRLSPGQITDDGELTLACANALAEGGNIFTAYKEWYRSRPFDCGSTCRAGMTGRPNAESQSNGSLMRVAPYGVRFRPQEAGFLAEKDSLTTHPNPVCCRACCHYATAISQLVWNEGWDVSLYGEIPAALDLDAKPSSSKIDWVKVAFTIAFQQLGSAPDFESGIVNAIARGGDTDTNAAIAGALLGARFGLDGIPKRWRGAVLLCHPHPLTAQPRPVQYWPGQVIRLADRLIEMR